MSSPQSGLGTSIKKTRCNLCREREKYQQLIMEGGLQEVVLADTDGSVYEGLSSNFGVFKDGKLITAPDDKVCDPVREVRVIIS